MFSSIQGLLGGNYHDGSLLCNQNGGQLASNAQMMNGYNSLQAQAALAHQYNQAQMAQQIKWPTWVFNGKQCTIREMADEIWHTDCPEKTHFLLKYE